LHPHFCDTFLPLRRRPRGEFAHDRLIELSVELDLNAHGLVVWGGASISAPFDPIEFLHHPRHRILHLQVTKHPTQTDAGADVEGQVLGRRRRPVLPPARIPRIDVGKAHDSLAPLRAHH